jgi:PST family polysaccharide transporter
LVILFVRGVLLARWLPVDVFGTYALGVSIVGLAVIVAEFGMSGAFLHRAPETEDESKAAAVHFTLRLFSAALLVLIMVPCALLLSSGPLRTALLTLSIAKAVTHITQTPRRILVRRVVHRRLALLDLINAISVTLVGLGLAKQGATLWALLSSQITSAVVNVVVLYIWKPVWRPRLVWSPQVMRYFLSFGSRGFLGGVFYRVLDRIDDLWAGLYLGDTALGFYSKAFHFATYPRKVLAQPLNTVAVGTYAELTQDRKGLSKGFFRVNALLVRSGFFMGGLLALIGPEFIRLLPGAKWLPMLDAFRLMLIFCLLDPLTLAMGSLFVAVGKPEVVTRVRFAQLIVMVVGLFILGPLWDIAGVAIAVDIMVVLGIGLLLQQARKYVDLSVTKLFLAPLVALAAGLLIARGSLLIPGVLGSDWRTAGVKIVLFVSTYTGILALSEFGEIRTMLRGVVGSYGLIGRVSDGTGKSERDHAGETQIDP